MSKRLKRHSAKGGRYERATDRTYKGILDFMFYAGIITTAAVPFIIRFYGRYNRYFGENIWELSLILSCQESSPSLS